MRGNVIMVLRTGFEPVSLAFSAKAREANILDRTILPELTKCQLPSNIKFFVAVWLGIVPPLGNANAIMVPPKASAEANK